jgi:transposase
MCLYVRDLTPKEGQQLTRILKSSTTAVYLRRAQVVAFSGQGMRVQEIAAQLHLHEEYVRELIRRFSAGSFKALRPRARTGGPTKYAPEEIAVIVEIATSRPQDLGLPFTVWSLRKLAEFLVEVKAVKEIS